MSRKRKGGMISLEDAWEISLMKFMEKLGRFDVRNHPGRAEELLGEAPSEEKLLEAHDQLIHCDGSTCLSLVFSLLGEMGKGMLLKAGGEDVPVRTLEDLKRFYVGRCKQSAWRDESLEEFSGLRLCSLYHVFHKANPGEDLEMLLVDASDQA